MINDLLFYCFTEYEGMGDVIWVESMGAALRVLYGVVTAMEHQRAAAV